MWVSDGEAEARLHELVRGREREQEQAEVVLGEFVRVRVAVAGPGGRLLVLPHCVVGEEVDT